MADLNILTEFQRAIYDQLAQGKPIDQIARNIDSTEALVKANITRIKGKGISLPTAGSTPPAPPANTCPVNDILGNPPKLELSGSSQNDQIANVLRNSEPALSAEELGALADKVGGQAIRDIHPMILMGITIQYVKMCGGRMTAHQVIEDVFSALKSFVGDKAVPEAETTTENFQQMKRNGSLFWKNRMLNFVTKCVICKAN